MHWELLMQGLNVLLIPLLIYVVKLETRLTRLETIMEERAKHHRHDDPA
jgi:hypothetical protein